MGFKKTDGTIITEKDKLGAGEYYPILEDYNTMDQYFF